MTPIKTKAGEILVLRLPSGQGDDFEIIRDQDNYDQMQFKFPSDKFWGLQNYSWINLPEGNWQFIGTISHDLKFSFDPKPFVDFEDIQIDETNCHLTRTQMTEELLIYRIESQNKILWSNPMERPKFDGRYDIISERYGEMDALREYEQEVKKYQSLQDLVIKEDEIAVVLLNPNK